ncbi:MAG: 30S ribosomal protein S15 [Methanoculleaceae archaeon]
MARIYARRRGRSQSVRPYRIEPPAWSNTDAEEIVKIILDLRRQGRSASEIGLELRDRHGVPSVRLATGKRITQILREHGLEGDFPEDLRNLIEKALRMRKHLEKNKKDVHNRRQLQLTESKIRRLVRYYVRTGRLPEGWSYKPETAEILLSR